MNDINYTGQGLIMSRQNSHGEFEIMKDKKLEKRLAMLLSRDIAALQKQHDAYIKAAQIAKAKALAKRKSTSRWQLSLQSVKTNLQMAAAYKAVIDRIREEG